MESTVMVSRVIIPKENIIILTLTPTIPSKAITILTLTPTIPEENIIIPMLTPTTLACKNVNSQVYPSL